MAVLRVFDIWQHLNNIWFNLLCAIVKSNKIFVNQFLNTNNLASF